MITANPLFNRPKKTDPCPCGSNKPYNICCGPYLEGTKQAKTAKALMRSRYTAYVTLNETYLMNTWHIQSRPEKLSLDADKTQWQQLKILNTKRGKLTDKKGWVAFAAFYLDEAGQEGVLKEESLFVREAGRWLYHSGVAID